MHRTAATVVLLLTSAFAPGAEAPAHRANGDLAIQARDVLRRYCAECHTGNTDPGKSKLKLLDHKQLSAKGKPVAIVAPGGRSQLLELVKDGSMPPANRTPPTPAEIAVLEKWVKANAPAYPEAFDERFVLETIADDLDQALAKDPTAAQHLRYASLAHLVADDAPVPNLVEAEQRLRTALLAASGSTAAPRPVDPTATVFRFDLRELGWSSRDLFEKLERRRPAGAYPLRAFDLLLLDYPHATTLPTEDPVAKRLTKFLDATNQPRPVPYLRGDWLASALSRPKQYRTPLAAELNGLAELERAGAAKPNGPPIPRAFGTTGPVTAARRPDSRAPLPPLSGWYTGDVAPAPAPFTLTAELVSDGRVVKSVKVDQSFKLRVSSDRRVFLTLLMIQADGEVRVQEFDGGNVLQPKVPRELAPGGGFNIAGILTGQDAVTEHFVLFAAESELPLPVVVQSTHPDRPVLRFVLEPTAKEPFDPNKVVRKVIPIPVARK